MCCKTLRYFNNGPFCRLRVARFYLWRARLHIATSSYFPLIKRLAALYFRFFRLYRIQQGLTHPKDILKSCRL